MLDYMQNCLTVCDHRSYSAAWLSVQSLGLRYVRENAHFSRNVFMIDTDTDNMTPSEVFEKDEEGCKLTRT